MLKQLAFLEGRENRASFFARIHKFAPPGHKDEALIVKAYNKAKDDCRGKPRESGERSFEHRRAVALIIVDVLGKLDPDLIAAALMHDSMEDCAWTHERLVQEFNESVAFLVDGVSMPLGYFPNREVRIEAYHQKFLAAAAIDPRVILIKLPDRLHNLLTCEVKTREKQLLMVEETEKLYLPLAKKYGILYKELSQVLRERRKSFRIGPVSRS